MVWILAATLALASMATRADGLWDVSRMLHERKWVDLTHPFDGEIPHWKGFDAMTRKVVYDYDKDGFRAEMFCHVGQWGTHIDPPAHFHKGGLTADRIPITQMLLPLVVIDVHRQAANNPDFVLKLEDLKSWEAKHGAVPEGAFVAMRTDWSRRWPDQKAMQNVDAQGTAHYPGWTLGALKYLYETRHITASGHETTDTDPGLATSKEDYSLEN
jgi:kynurenine formamidase